MEDKTTRYRRAQPYAPTPDDLKAFAGRYESDEIESVLQMPPAKGGLLVMRLELSPDKALEFRPVDRDTFQMSRMTVRFYRDKAGKVVAFDYSNPVACNIKFTRLGHIMFEAKGKNLTVREVLPMLQRDSRFRSTSRQATPATCSATALMISATANSTLHCSGQRINPSEPLPHVDC